MQTVLIADDEPKVGILINSLVEWDTLDLVLVGIVDNGKKAFEFVRENAPDIVITDIKMPGMDGLDLIRRVRDLGLNTEFIVISGHRNFEYARSAIRYGVEDYLLKPIGQKELNDTLRKICADRLNAYRHEEEERGIRRQLRRSQAVLQEGLIEKILNDDVPFDDLKQVNEAYALNLAEGSFQAIAVRLDYKVGVEWDVDQDRVVVARIEELIESAMVDRARERIVARVEPRLIVCALNFGEPYSPGTRTVLNALFDTLRDYVYVFGSYEITMGIGDMVEGFHRLPETIKTALRAIRYRIRLGSNRAIFHEDYEYAEGHPSDLALGKEREEFNKSITRLDIEGLRSAVNNTFIRLGRDHSMDPGYFYEAARDLTENFFEQMALFGMDALLSSREELMAAIADAHSVASLSDLLVNRLPGLLGECRELRATRINRPIREAKRYIDEHYAEKVFLEDIAKTVNMNPVYFSVIFKNETGSNFTDYIVNIRMEAAKTLLRETFESVAAVAEKVGYKDTRYFSRLFAKAVGIKPAMYRKLYS